MLLESRKLAVKPQGGRNVEFFICQLGSRPKPEAFLFSPVVNRSQKAIWPSLRNSFVSGFIVLAYAFIELLLRAIGYAKVFIGIVHSIATYMIALPRIAVAQSKDIAVHVNQTTLSILAETVTHNVELSSLASLHCLPRPTVDIVVLRRGDASNLSLRQLDFTVRFFKRHPQSFLSHASGLYQQPMPLLYLESCGA